VTVVSPQASGEGCLKLAQVGRGRPEVTTSPGASVLVYSGGTETGDRKVQRSGSSSTRACCDVRGGFGDRGPPSIRGRNGCQRSLGTDPPGRPQAAPRVLRFQFLFRPLTVWTRARRYGDPFCLGRETAHPEVYFSHPRRSADRHGRTRAVRASCVGTVPCASCSVISVALPERGAPPARAAPPRRPRCTGSE
jgi:hypothetical protein